MARVTVNKQPSKLVWRITADAPLGEYVDPKQAVTHPPTTNPVDPRDHGWLASSLELLGGVRVSEAPMDTLPGDLIDQFFKR